MKIKDAIFKPRARLMLLLGDQLIRDAGIAVFELVKNAYDADAHDCKITLFNINTPNAGIVIEDSGTGMTPEIVMEVWLEPGTDYRKEQRDNKVFTPKGRLPLGNKGIGRFAVHKLGDKIKMITRAAEKEEVVVEIDWRELFGDESPIKKQKSNKKKYLSEISLNVKIRGPQYFKGDKTGTRIEVSALRENWTRGKVRELYRSVTSICSPFQTVNSKLSDTFNVQMALEPEPDPRRKWLSGLLNIQEVIDLALFHGSGTLNGSDIVYDYEFKPLPAMESKIKGRFLKNIKGKLSGTLPEDIDKVRPGGKVKPRPLNLSDWDIGPVSFDFYIYDREPIVMELATSDKAGLKKFLDINGGVRVFRDGIRVYDFGEPGNDWLGLGDRRVNIPVRRIGNNQIVAAVSLDSQKSAALKEKTNREGFIENDAYYALREAVLCALRQVEIERNFDKERLRKVYSRKKIKEPVVEEIAILREKLGKKKILEEFESIIDRIESQYIEARERLLSPAAAGLNLAVVIHEVEKIVDNIVEAVERNVDRDKLSQLLKNLSNTIDGITFLLRSSGKKEEKAGVLIRQAIFNFEYRFNAHKIKVINGLEKENRDYSVPCYRRLVVSTLMNLMDNSIYWLENKGEAEKQIYIGITEDLDGGPAFIVADNGPGFQEHDPPEYLIQPFVSRKDDGMGLGLHIANEVAKLHKGHLIFPELDDVEIPAEFTGAVVALQIPMQKE
jgi:signal transduction histidine kinase/anti-sigma regulatory factor (Ser/Thr protein kinase)